MLMSYGISNEIKNNHFFHAADIASMIQQLFKKQNEIMRREEHFWLIGLDDDDRIKFVQLVAIGQMNHVYIESSTLFRLCIYNLVSKAILIHNHPTGSLEASEEDLDTTERLIKSGALVNVCIIDHIIINENGYLSFKDQGLIEELENSDRWKMLTADDLLERKQKFIDEEGKKTRLQIARSMQESGMPGEKIIQLTGLEPSDLENLYPQPATDLQTF